MKLVYIGELSGVVLPVPPGRPVKRGEPFVIEDVLGHGLMLGDPTRWREATVEEAAALDLLLEAARLEAEEKQRLADEVSLAVAMEEDAKLAAIMDPATGGGGTGGDLSPVETPVALDAVVVEAEEPPVKKSKKKHEE